ncbi:peptidoglycan editing factor PgeF [Roseateles asaccharophilus]|uniref:Purine nucleoside phosphorylase n=1 Tax=Roseateles asaccharophilus TaxID=582607 RepID=A0ABU2A2G7_9BURK|nr:peptidoglycan editing factor PgeF [Roseateles asaccharophilus]MDR7331379.1 YfiH family protein [Roseateles asaccharophilus]
MPVDTQWLHPDWTGTTAFMTTRGFNCGRKAGDAAEVQANRAEVARRLGARPIFLDQVHGADVVRLRPDWNDDNAPQADAAVSTDPELAVAILVADCLPVLFSAPGGVAGAHAGWRGLAAGVLENTVAELCAAAGCEPRDVKAWLGACIGPAAFEVGPEVVAAFGREAIELDQPGFLFRPNPQPRWRVDLPLLARERLRGAGVTEISGGTWCTLTDDSRFFSFRGESLGRPRGRMAACISLR